MRGTNSRGIVLAIFSLTLLGACQHDLSGVGQPDLAAADTGGPDAAVSDRGKPDLAAVDRGKPDVAAADKGKPDLAAVDKGKPDLAAPDTGKPDLVPDKSKPDLVVPDANIVDAALVEGGATGPFQSVGKTPIIITSGNNNQSSPAVAVGKLYYLVVWADDSTGYSNLYAVRISRKTGIIKDATPLKVGHMKSSVTTWPSLNPSVAYRASTGMFIVVWDEFRQMQKEDDIYTVSIAETTTKTEFPASILHSNKKPQTDPAIACEPTQCLVAFVDQSSSIAGPQKSHIRGVRITTPASASLLSIAISTSKTKKTPAVASGGKGSFLVVWTDSRKLPDHEIWGALVTKSAGTYKEMIVSSTSGVTFNKMLTPSVAFGANQYLVVWENQATKSIIMGRRFTSTGGIVHANHATLHYTGSQQVQPAAAGNMAHHAMVWSEQRLAAVGDYDLYASRVDSSSKAMKKMAPETTVSKAVKKQQNPAIVWSSDGYLVVWESINKNYATDIHAVRIAN